MLTPLNDQEQNLVKAWFAPEVQTVLNLMPHMTRIILNVMHTCVIEAFGGQEAFTKLLDQTIARIGDEVDEFTRNLSEGDK